MGYATLNVACKMSNILFPAKLLNVYSLIFFWLKVITSPKLTSSATFQFCQWMKTQPFLSPLCKTAVTLLQAGSLFPFLFKILYNYVLQAIFVTFYEHGPGSSTYKLFSEAAYMFVSNLPLMPSQTMHRP